MLVYARLNAPNTFVETDRAGQLHVLASTAAHRVSAGLTWRPHACTTLNDDISPRAADYCLDFCLLGLWHRELVKGLLEIVEKGFPFCRRYHEMLMRFLHGAACVFLRPTSGPTQHLRDEIFEACRGDAMMRLIYPWVCVEAGIDHDPVDEVIDHCGDAVDTAESFVKAERRWW